MKIKIIMVGKTSMEWCQKGEAYYTEKLRYFPQIEKIQVAEEKITAGISEENIKKREGEKMLQKVLPQEYLVALSPKGKKFSSEEFSEFLKKVRDIHGGKICFCIGGPLGLSEEVLKKANLVLSFSDITFPHDLFRIILLEQLFRGFSILARKKYHK